MRGSDGAVRGSVLYLSGLFCPCQGWLWQHGAQSCAQGGRQQSCRQRREQQQLCASLPWPGLAFASLTPPPLPPPAMSKCGQPQVSKLFPEYLTRAQREVYHLLSAVRRLSLCPQGPQAKPQSLSTAGKSRPQHQGTKRSRHLPKLSGGLAGRPLPPLLQCSPGCYLRDLAGCLGLGNPPGSSLPDIAGLFLHSPHACEVVCHCLHRPVAAVRLPRMVLAFGVGRIRNHEPGQGAGGRVRSGSVNSAKAA